MFTMLVLINIQMEKIFIENIFKPHLRKNIIITNFQTNFLKLKALQYDEIVDSFNSFLVFYIAILLSKRNLDLFLKKNYLFINYILFIFSYNSDKF